MITGVIGFFAMDIDKARAIGSERRVPEITLPFIAPVGGSLGMAIGSEVFHHKSSKLEFLIILYPIVALWLCLLLRIGFWTALLPTFRTKECPVTSGRRLVSSAS